MQTDRFSAERGQHRFVQSVVRQVAYATQSRRDRKARHVAAADYLRGEPDPGDDLAVLIAQHLLDAVDAAQSGDAEVPGLTDTARTYLERAAARSRGIGSPSEAQRLLELALDHTVDPRDRGRVHLAAALAAIDAGRHDLGVAHAQTATEVFDGLGDVVSAGTAAGAQAAALVHLGDNSTALAVAEPRIEGLDRVPGAERALLGLSMQLTRAHQRLGDWPAAGTGAERVLLLAEALGDPEALSSAYILFARRFGSIGTPATERALYEAALDLAREHELPEPLGRALLNLGSILNGRDLPAALASSQEAIDVGRRYGQQVTIDFASLNRLLALWIAGRQDEVASGLAEAWDVVVDPEHPDVPSRVGGLARRGPRRTDRGA